MKNLTEIAAVFFRLGCIAFGGPAAHIALMEEEIVTRRKWMSRQHFLDLIGATNLIPGPNSTEMTMHCGHERGGVPGLFVAGICFIVPAVAITGVLAWLYAKYGQLPAVEPFVYGIKPAVLAIIAGAISKFGKTALKGLELQILGAIVLIVSLLGVNEILALLCAGLVGGIYFWLKNRGQAAGLFPILFLQAVPGAVSASISTAGIFWSFLKVGAVLYGSGYVLFAYLDTELVVRGWLSRTELMDAIAVGQFTPGPLLSTATFVGWQLNGWQGALAATVGIFLPSFLFVWLLNPLVPRMRRSKFLSGFLDSVNVAAVAVMVAVFIEMGRDALTDWRTFVIAIFSFSVAFFWKKVNAVWLVAGGAVLGWFLRLYQ